MTTEYRWSGFDKNRWDHYYAAGEQIRFYRECPSRTGASIYIGPAPRWVRVIRFVVSLFK